MTKLVDELLRQGLQGSAGWTTVTLIKDHPVSAQAA